MPSEDQSSRSSVQTYIDETPVWSDGTVVSGSPMTRMQWRIWSLAAAGKFFEGMVVFMTGVALPLIGRDWGLDPIQTGVVGAASLFGILVGASTLGGLADRYGRRSIFIIEMALFCVFLALLTISTGYWWLVICLFGTGVALGGDYPTAHLIISEAIPSRIRGKLVLSAFGFQAVGALAGTLIGYVVLLNDPALDAWRWMYASALIPAVLVLIGRFTITESAPWLLSRHRTQEAERATLRLLDRNPPYPTEVVLEKAWIHHETNSPHDGSRFRDLFSRRHRRATILAAVPWFLQDLGTYGIGIFTPLVLAASFGHGKDHPNSLSDLIGNEILAAKGAAFLDVLLIVGILAAVLLADRMGRIWLQILGFIGCAVGLFIASMAVGMSEPMATILIFVGLMLFNFMTNMGPNAQTYLLAGEVFPTAVRGRGAGFAASFAKIGAVTTVFLFPILLHEIGEQVLLWILVATSLMGAAVTWGCRVETTGINLDDVGKP
jgi:putative MFS transporter